MKPIDKKILNLLQICEARIPRQNLRFVGGSVKASSIQGNQAAETSFETSLYISVEIFLKKSEQGNK